MFIQSAGGLVQLQQRSYSLGGTGPHCGRKPKHKENFPHSHFRFLFKLAWVGDAFHKFFLCQWVLWDGVTRVRILSLLTKVKESVNGERVKRESRDPKSSPRCGWSWWNPRKALKQINGLRGPCRKGVYLEVSFIWSQEVLREQT